LNIACNVRDSMPDYVIILFCRRVGVER